MDDFAIGMEADTGRECLAAAGFSGSDGVFSGGEAPKAKAYECTARAAGIALNIIPITVIMTLSLKTVFPRLSSILPQPTTSYCAQKETPRASFNKTEDKQSHAITRHPLKNPPIFKCQSI